MRQQTLKSIKTKVVDITLGSVASSQTAEARAELMSIIKRITVRGWCPATAGNFSVLLDKEPIRMLITPSGVDKNLISGDDLLEVNEKVEVLSGKGNPTAEGLIHAAVYQTREAGSVLHVHTVANTVLSEKHLSSGYIEISGYEILKAFPGVSTHEHTERIPIFANSQDMKSLSENVREKLKIDQSAKGVLLAGHGIYTWGRSPQTAYQHLEAFEFLFEVLSRKS
ncbi:MAG TPA: methylthioribulose 1-phosphate dehydratase [candidate division Zixibacteria bacterium]|nr:methylthioribulose 1-phosphate dehydratase [candidate division Zixibacteria bacterium]